MLDEGLCPDLTLIIALLVSLVAFGTAATAEPRCLFTLLRIDCGDAGTAMRTPRRSVAA